MRVKRSLLIGLAAAGLGVLAGIRLSEPRPEAKLYRGKSVRAWAVQLNAPSQQSREAAAATIQALGTNAVPGLVRLLRARDSFFRQQIWSLAPRLPALLRQAVLSRVGAPEAVMLRRAAARGLGVLGSEAKGAVPALAGVLRTDGVHEVRWEAAQALGRIGKPAVPELAAALADKDPNQRYAALCALEECGSAALAAAPTMLKALWDENDGVRVQAGQSFAKLGPEVLPFLTHALASRDSLTRRRAATAMTVVRVPRQSKVAPLLAMLHDEEPACRAQAVQTLATLGIPDGAMIAGYRSALKDPVREVRLAAARALGQARLRAALAVPALAEGLDDESAAVRALAAQGLGGFGARAHPAAAKLAQLLQDKEGIVRAAARNALAHIEPAETTIPTPGAK